MCLMLWILLADTVFIFSFFICALLFFFLLFLTSEEEEVKSQSHLVNGALGFSAFIAVSVVPLVLVPLVLEPSTALRASYLFTGG